MESQLAEFELKMGIKQRWRRTDKEYVDAQQTSLVTKKESTSIAKETTTAQTILVLSFLLALVNVSR